MKEINKSLSKKGVASLYVVIFATILFGVITLSFIRIILSESQQTGNDDLSQSAYDAAMAGVEDAKLAVNQWYKSGRTGNLFETGDITKDGCGDGTTSTFRLKSFLYPGSGAGEVKIQDTTNSGNNTEQAYTCVLLKNIVDDYRSTLTSDTRTKVVPLGIDSSKISTVNKIEISWYSKENGLNFDNLNFTDKKLRDKNNTSTPPVLSVTFLRTTGTIKIDDFNTSESSDYGSMLFLPTDNGTDVVTTLSEAAISNAGKSSVPNTPYRVQCYNGKEFACTVTLTPTMTDIKNAMLIISMPYGNTMTDFQVVLKHDDTVIPFENVQISVDSTGRANQLVRRVETRLDPTDLFFPYPEYEVELTGGEENSFLKNFWITANCWTDQGPCPNNGSV